MIERQPTRAVTGILAGTAVACYVAALFMPAHFEIGLDLGGGTYSGLECLTHPFIFPFIVMEYPSWFANPLWIGSLYCLWQRIAKLATGLAILAVLCVSLSHRDHRALPGYWLWGVSMVLAAFAALWELSSARKYQFADAKRNPHNPL